MRLMAGTSGLLYVACLLAFVMPLVCGGMKRQLVFQWDRNTSWRALAWMLPLLLIVYAVGFILHLDAASGLPYCVGGLLAYWLLSCFPALQSGVWGALLLLLAVVVTGNIQDAAFLSVALVSTLAGLSAGRFICQNTPWVDYLLPTVWLVGVTWMAVGSPETLQGPYGNLFAIILSVTLLLRAVQSLPLLSETHPVIRPVFITVTGGLAAWLLCQTLLLQPSLLSWVWLFVGGLALGFALPPLWALTSSDCPSGVQGAIQLVLLGLAALVASRLFGTLGWVVLAVGLLGNVKQAYTVAIGALFFVGRGLLQVYLLQYNPNVTGINITHPYASAAMYFGLVVMLLLPGWLNSVLSSESLDASDETAVLTPANTGVWTLLFGLFLAAGAFANYFLHAEATGSLLVSLVVDGLVIGLLGRFQRVQAGAYAAFLPMVTIGGALISQELLSAGNEAGKSQKILVLGVALLVIFALSFLLARFGSGRKPVPVA